MPHFFNAPRTLKCFDSLQRRIGLALAIASSLVAIQLTFVPGKVIAEFVNNYPDMDAVDCANQFGKYSWCKNGRWLSSRGYGYRNCTDGTAYWVHQYTGIDVRGWGNAKDWDEGAAKNNRLVRAGNTENIEPGDIAQSDDGGWGHVGFVVSVSKNSNGTISSFTAAELNHGGKGEYGTHTYSARNSARKFVYGSNDWDHFIDVNGIGKGLNNEGLFGGGGRHIGSTTLGVYDPAGAVFHPRDFNTPGPAGVSVQFGNANWIPLAGDWDNNGTFTPGAYDPATGWFYLRNSHTPGPADTAFLYGNIGWIPMAGDWEGNGYWSIGLYDPNTSTFYLRSENSSGPADYTFNFGNGGWRPIAGDWDNNDSSTIGVYNPNTATYYLNDQHDGSAAERTIQYGNIGWTPLAGDWDGNGWWSIGAYDSNTAVFYLRNMNDGGPADYTIQYGNIGWKPVVGNWDGR